MSSNNNTDFLNAWTTYLTIPQIWFPKNLGLHRIELFCSGLSRVLPELRSKVQFTDGNNEIVSFAVIIYPNKDRAHFETLFEFHISESTIYIDEPEKKKPEDKKRTIIYVTEAYDWEARLHDCLVEIVQHPRTQNIVRQMIDW